MTRGALRKLAAIAGAAVALTFAAPVAAQNYSDGYKLLQSVEKKDRSEFDKLVAKNHTVINARDLSNGRTGVHIAVARRDITWLTYLAQAGANTNVADSRGVTPIMLASQLGWIEGVQALIGHGAQVDVPNSAGETPLISSVHRRDTQLMRILLGAGADPDRTDNSGRSARDYAKQDGRDSLTLAEIEKSAANSGGRRAGGDTYGPSF